MKRKFQIEVNKSRYDVYPLFETMVDKATNNHEAASAEAKKIIDKVFDGKSIPISRRVILQHYFATVLKNLQLNK